MRGREKGDWKFGESRFKKNGYVEEYHVLGNFIHPWSVTFKECIKCCIYIRKVKQKLNISFKIKTVWRGKFRNLSKAGGIKIWKHARSRNLGSFMRKVKAEKSFYLSSFMSVDASYWGPDMNHWPPTKTPQSLNKQFRTPGPERCCQLSIQLNMQWKAIN